MSGAEDDPHAALAARGGSYYPAPDELDPAVDINLNSLRDAPGPDGKPLYSYATLIRYAIKGSPEGRLLLEEIYYAIEQRYPYFKTAPAGWKNSVRHNLSLNACFEKMPRPLTDRGKGSYWTVNDGVDPKQGIHRIRSRRRKPNKLNDHTASPVPYPFPPYGSGDGSYDPYGAMYPYGYDPSMFPPPFMPGGSEMTGGPIPFSDPTLGPSPDHVPENLDWRAMYLGEVERLKSITKEQDKQAAPQDWYRMMIVRLRIGMMGVPPFMVSMNGEGPGNGTGGSIADNGVIGGGDDDNEEEDE